jgi:hypothetical protein
MKRDSFVLVECALGFIIQILDLKYFQLGKTFHNTNFEVEFFTVKHFFHKCLQ